MTKLLSPDEYVIGKITSPDRDLYATNKRVLVFQKSLWYALFFLLGILPGLLAWLLTPKSLRRFVEYSRLLGTEFVSHRPTVNMICGLVLGLLFLIPGVVLMVMFWGTGGAFFGWFLVFLGGLYVVMFCVIKQTYCQFKITNVGESELKKWRIYLPKIGSLPGKIRQFARLVDANSARPAQAPGFVPAVPAAIPVVATRPAAKPTATPPGPTAIPLTAARPPEIPAVPTTARKVEAPIAVPAAPPTVVFPSIDARIVLPDNSEIQITEKTRPVGRNDFIKYVSSEVLKFLSREHILIEFEEGKYHIVDTDSSNGTKVNGILLKSGEKYELKDGDCIILGEVLTLVFRTGDAPLKARPPVPQEVQPEVEKEEVQPEAVKEEVQPEAVKEEVDVDVKKPVLSGDNVGTRMDTFSKASSYWISFMSSGSVPPFVCYKFPGREESLEGFSSLSFIKQASDTGEFITLVPTLYYGFYEVEPGLWEVLICGDTLTRDMYQEAVEKLTRAGGTLKDRKEPSAAETPVSSGNPSLAAQVSLTRQENKGEYRYHVYHGPSREAALEFLKSLQPVTELYVYHIVETPDGNFGRDKDGIYREKT